MYDDGVSRSSTGLQVVNKWSTTKLAKLVTENRETERGEERETEKGDDG